jgi:hypothetical protein
MQHRLGHDVSRGMSQHRQGLGVTRGQNTHAVAVGQQPPLCTLEDGVQALRVNLAALKSGEERSVQMILTG